MSEEVHRSAPSGLLAGLLAGGLWCLPAAWRIAGDALAWGALVGSAALSMGPLVVSAQVLRPASTGTQAALFGFALAAAPLAWLGALLETRTHHRPLGGATFAVMAAAIGVACLVAMHRLQGQSRLIWGLARGVALLSFVLAVVWLVPSLGLASVRAAALDVVFGMVLIVAASRVPVPLGRAAARFVPWAWAAVVIAGLGAIAVRGGSDLVAAAPAVAALGHWIASWLAFGA